MEFDRAFDRELGILVEGLIGGSVSSHERVHSIELVSMCYEACDLAL